MPVTVYALYEIALWKLDTVLWKSTVCLIKFLSHIQEVCHCLETLGSKSQCFDIFQNGICKYLVRPSLFKQLKYIEELSLHLLYTESTSCICYVSQSRLVVVPDNMAAGLLRAVSRLLDLSVLPVEPMLRFLSQCCFSLLTLLISLQPAETNHKR